MVNCKPEQKTIGAGLPSGIQRWQIVDCQNSQGTAWFGQNLVTTFSCVVRGLEIVLSRTSACMEIYHLAKHIGPSSADGPDVGWQLLVDVGDGHGLTMQRPSLHHQHVANGVDETAHVQC